MSKLTYNCLASLPFCSIIILLFLETRPDRKQQEGCICAALSVLEPFALRLLARNLSYLLVHSIRGKTRLAQMNFSFLIHREGILETFP
jgi:hypothetical protein